MKWKLIIHRSTDLNIHRMKHKEQFNTIITKKGEIIYSKIRRRLYLPKKYENYAL